MAFGPALRAPFDFDDLPAITQNATIRTFSPPWASLHTPPLGSAVSGRPVVNVSFALNHAVNQWLGIVEQPNGESPDAVIGYRVVNLLLHIITALLLFAVIRITLQLGRVPDDIVSKAAPLAAVISGLWLIHPLQTEAVDYASQRTEIMVSLWYIAAMYCCIRHREALALPSTPGPHSDRRWFVAAVVASALGMASKEVMVTAPFVIALHDRTFFSTSWREVWSRRERRWLYVVLFATIGITVGLDLTNGRAETVGFGLGITPLQYAITQGWAIPRYLRLVIWPSALTYDYGQLPIETSGAALGLIAVCAVVAGTVLLWRRERWRWAAFLVAFFFLLIAPSSSIVPIRTEIAAERRVYLAIAAVLTLVVVGTARAISWIKARLGSSENVVSRPERAFVGAALAALAAALLITSARRSSMYERPALLWADAMAKMPTNARAYDNLGAAMLRETPPRYDAADTLFMRAIALDSAFLDPWRRRASVAVKQGRVDDAQRFLLHVLSVAPNDSLAIASIGKVYLLAGRPDLAVPYLHRLTQESVDPAAFSDLGNAYLLMGRLDSATATLHRAIAVNPNSPEAYRLLGAMLVDSGHGTEAVSYLERSVALDATSGFSYALLSIAYGDAENAERAVQAATAAVERAGSDATIFVLAGRGMQAARHPELAVQYYARAVQLSPNDPEALTRFGIAEATLGNRENAVKLLTRALTLSPGYRPAQQALRAMGLTPSR